MVPPMLKTQSMAADQKLANPSENGRVPITANDMSMSSTVNPRIEYLTDKYAKNKKFKPKGGQPQNKNTKNIVSRTQQQYGDIRIRTDRIHERMRRLGNPVLPYHHPAISFLDEPPHSLLARYVV
jgi:hypothetical protein